MFYRWNRKDIPPDRRQQMIDETSAFLTLALRSGSRVPRIPRRRVDSGGYDRLLQSAGARAAVHHWWSLAMEAVGAIADRS